MREIFISVASGLIVIGVTSKIKKLKAKKKFDSSTESNEDK